MKKLTLSAANAYLADLMQDPEGDPVILMRDKKPIAVILPVGDADLETVSLSFSPKFHAILRRSDWSAIREGTVSHEEICREFGMALAADRKPKSKSSKPKGKNRKSKAG